MLFAVLFDTGLAVVFFWASQQKLGIGAFLLMLSIVCILSASILSTKWAKRTWKESEQMDAAKRPIRVLEEWENHSI